MKFTIQTIMSLPADGASSHLLIFSNTIKILLDCGISPAFDLTKYRERAQDLKEVCLVLISHSSLQYSGALCFLIDELGLNPKIFYTTQPIMRCSPLNIHESILSLHCPHYNKKVFNKIYRIYQNINIIKPQQKKSLEVEEQSKQKQKQKTQTLPVVEKSAMEEEEKVEETNIGEVEKIIYFTCYPAGSSMCNLTWRINYGIVNILYLVEYNNYSLHHIGGVDVSQLIQSTDILITDTCREIDDEYMKKSNLYELVKGSIVDFYERSGLSVAKPPPITNLENESKLLFTCEPGEMVVEVMAVAKQVLEELQTVESREKLRVIHLSSRFLQLIKSQIDYFSPYFKETLENIEQDYSHSKTISGRINITTLSTLHTLLNDQLTPSLHIIHLGPIPNPDYLPILKQKGLQNISSLGLFLPDEKLLHSASKIEEQKEQQKQKQKYKQKEKQKSIEEEAEKMVDEKEQRSETQFRDTEKSEKSQQIEEEEQNQFHLNQPLHGKYLSQIGFPHFVKKPREEDHDYDEYGIRHQYARFEERQSIDEYRRENDQARDGQLAHKKNATIQVMNIEFKNPERYVDLDFSLFKRLKFSGQKTNFNSSIQLILTLKPSNVIFINTKSTPRSPDELASKYRTILQRKTQSIKKVYELAPKNYCHIEVKNQLISYKVNYIPIPQDRKLQKVKGVINYSSNGTLCIHLECLDQRELLEFKFDQFYRQLKKQEHSCTFTKRGIVVEGVCIYREGKSIILEGQYSEKYFKVRRLLYDFLQIQ